MFKRNIETKISNFIDNSIYKAQIILGVRQCGKTTVVKKVSSNYDNVIYLSLEDDIYRSIFSCLNTNVNEYLIQIELLTEYTFDRDKQIILILDEIQFSNSALASLKYFAESEIDIKVIALGSLLGITFKSTSFPVGKVDMLHMYPLSFDEFLSATGNEKYIEVIRTSYVENKLAPALHDNLLKIFDLYLHVGSMPQSVHQFLTSKNINDSIEVQKNINESYYNDIGKYVQTSDNERIKRIFNEVPGALGRDNQKFIMKNLESGARYDKYQASFAWLEAAQLTYPAYIIKTPVFPLKSNFNFKSFKLFYCDTALLISHANYKLENLYSNNKIYLGLVIENYVATELMKIDNKLFCFDDGNKEIDFLIERNSTIIPIEVKAATNTKSKSLNSFMKQNNTELAIRISSKNFGIADKIKSIPHYAVFCLDNF